MKTPTKSGNWGSKNNLLGTDKLLDIGTGKDALDVFIVKVHVPDENSHEIWSNGAIKIIFLALISLTLELEKKSLIFS